MMSERDQIEAVRTALGELRRTVAALETAAEQARAVAAIDATALGRLESYQEGLWEGKREAAEQIGSLVDGVLRVMGQE